MAATLSTSGITKFRRWYNQYRATHGTTPPDSMVQNFLQGELEAKMANQERLRLAGLEERRVALSESSTAESLRLQREQIQNQERASTVSGIGTLALGAAALSKEGMLPSLGFGRSPATTRPADVSMTSYTPAQIQQSGGAYGTPGAATLGAETYSGASLATSGQALATGGTAAESASAGTAAANAATSASASASSGGIGSIGLNSATGVGVIIGAALGAKSLAQSSRPKDGGKDWGVINSPVQYFAEAASHPVAAVTSPGTILSDIGLFDKDTVGFTGKIEEEIMKPFSGIFKEGTVVCTELYRQKLMDDETYLKDIEFGERQDVETIVGYHTWGIPLANLMRRSKTVTKIVTPIALAWAEDMAGKSNIFGHILNKIGIPVCRLIGRIKMRGLKWQTS